jgi:hypothetical protein
MLRTRLPLVASHSCTSPVEEPTARMLEAASFIHDTEEM